MFILRVVLETLRFSCLNERNVNLIPIWAVIWSYKDFAAKWHLAPAYDAFWYYILVWTWFIRWRYVDFIYGVIKE